LLSQFDRIFSKYIGKKENTLWKKKKKKKKNGVCRVPHLTLDKVHLCRVPRSDTRQSIFVWVSLWECDTTVGHAGGQPAHLRWTSHAMEQPSSKTNQQTPERSVCFCSHISTILLPERRANQLKVPHLSARASWPQLRVPVTPA